MRAPTSRRNPKREIHESGTLKVLEAWLSLKTRTVNSPIFLGFTPLDSSCFRVSVTAQKTKVPASFLLLVSLHADVTISALRHRSSCNETRSKKEAGTLCLRCPGGR